MESSSSVTYRYENKRSFKKDGVKHVYNEVIIDGPKGLTVEYLKKEGEKDFHKLSFREDSNNPDKFKLTEKKNHENPITTDKTATEFKKMIKENKALAFAVNYVEKERGKYKGFDELEPPPAANNILSHTGKKVSKTAKKVSKTAKKVSKQPKKLSKQPKKASKKSSKQTKK